MFIAFLVIYEPLKVYYFRIILFIKHDIKWFDIAMKSFVFMKNMQALHDFIHYVDQKPYIIVKIHFIQSFSIFLNIY